jgi:hypothetical protein
LQNKEITQMDNTAINISALTNPNRINNLDKTVAPYAQTENFGKLYSHEEVFEQVWAMFEKQYGYNPSFGQGSTLFALFHEAPPRCRQSLQG